MFLYDTADGKVVAVSPVVTFVHAPPVRYWIFPLQKRILIVTGVEESAPYAWNNHFTFAASGAFPCCTVPPRFVIFPWAGQAFCVSANSSGSRIAA
jgi:hypothetical protein